MTNPDHSYVAALVDRSGSMQDIRTDAEYGLKAFLAEQRALPGKLTIDLYQFDTEFERVADPDSWTLKPRGTTALYDAMGKAITSVGEILSAMPEDERPGKVIFVTVTDGLENASREWNREKVFDAVTHQTENYAWQFVFTAANQDALATGSNLGVSRASSMTFDASAAGVTAAYTNLSRSVSSYRSGATHTVNLPDLAEAVED